MNDNIAPWLIVTGLFASAYTAGECRGIIDDETAGDCVPHKDLSLYQPVPAIYDLETDNWVITLNPTDTLEVACERMLEGNVTVVNAREDECALVPGLDRSWRVRDLSGICSYSVNDLPFPSYH